MKKSLAITGIFCMFLFIQSKLVAQVNKDSIHLDSSRIYATALDGNIRSVLQLVNVDSNLLAPAARKLKFKFEKRFTYGNDENIYPAYSSPFDSLLKIYVAYWRTSLLSPDSNYDIQFEEELSNFLASHYPPSKILTSTTNKDSIDDYLSRYLKEYLESIHLHSTGFGKTGKLLDLLVWKTQNDTIYKFRLNGDQMEVPIVMMEDFITLGWEEYATLGKYYPGGWTTKQSLFCVKRAYDLTSEDFLISYLAHEGRHFADYKLFPKLKSPDLEYRAKLVEISLAKKTLYESIDFFINNGNCNSDNGHSKANYCVIRDLSRNIFSKAFEADKIKWRTIPADKINMAAAAILRSNTRALQLKGRDVETYITCKP